MVDTKFSIGDAVVCKYNGFCGTIIDISIATYNISGNDITAEILYDILPLADQQNGMFQPAVQLAEWMLEKIEEDDDGTIGFTCENNEI